MLRDGTGPATYEVAGLVHLTGGQSEFAQVRGPLAVEPSTATYFPVLCKQCVTTIGAPVEYVIRVSTERFRELAESDEAESLEALRDLEEIRRRLVGDGGKRHGLQDVADEFGVDLDD